MRPNVTFAQDCCSRLIEVIDCTHDMFNSSAIGRVQRKSLESFESTEQTETLHFAVV